MYTDVYPLDKRMKEVLVSSVMECDLESADGIQVFTAEYGASAHAIGRYRWCLYAQASSRKRKARNLITGRPVIRFQLVLPAVVQYQNTKSVCGIVHG